MKKSALVLVSLLALPALAQQPFRIEAKGHYGFLIPHRQGMKNLIKGHVPGFEVSYDAPTLGKKAWHHLHNFPDWGITAYYADLANPAELGYAAGAYPYISWPIIRKEKFDFYYQLGWGFGYVSEIWDRENNFKNIVIGSHVNAIIGMRWIARWRLTSRISQAAGIAFTHFSNAAYQVPNLGWNIPTATTGLSLSFGNVNIKPVRDTLENVSRKFDFTLIAAGGVKEVYPPGQKKFPAFSLTMDVARALSRKSKLGTELNLYYNSSLRKRLATDSTTASPASILQPGLSLNYRMQITRVSMMMGMGGYLYTTFKGDGYFYHRIGMRYDWNERVAGSLILKTHFFRADFLELGIGYKLNKH